MTVKRLVAASIVAFGLSLAVCASEARAADKVTLRAAWSWAPDQTPFFVAQAKGFYKDANLEVEILQGQGSKTTSLVVGQGKDTFGINSLATTAASISADVPVKAVAGYWQRGPIGLICDAARNVKTPADLKGLTIASTPSGSDGQLLPPFLSANKLGMQDIKTVALTDAKLPALLTGKVDCISGDVYYWQPLAEEQGKKTTGLLYADYGITNLSFGLIANTDFIAKNPDIVRRFVAASLKGVEYAHANIDEAADIFLKATGSTQSKTFVTGVLAYWKGQTHTQATAGKPLGWIATEDWNQMNDILEKYGDMKGRKPTEVYFTNDFLPKK
ncbi:MAG: ABC transporter substrate-binding protein [Pseudorhodoplanes sp.]